MKRDVHGILQHARAVKIGEGNARRHLVVADLHLVIRETGERRTTTGKQDGFIVRGHRGHGFCCSVHSHGLRNCKSSKR